MTGSKCGRSLASKIFATAIGLSASATSPYTVSVGSATISPFRKSAVARSVAALRERRRQSEIAATVSVFTFGRAAQAPHRFAFYERFPDSYEFFHRTVRRCSLRATRHFLRPMRRWPASRRERRPAFAPSIEANRDRAALAIASARLARAARYKRRLLPPNARRRPL